MIYGNLFGAFGISHSLIYFLKHQLHQKSLKISLYSNVHILMPSYSWTKQNIDNVKVNVSENHQNCTIVLKSLLWQIKKNKNKTNKKRIHHEKQIHIQADPYFRHSGFLAFWNLAENLKMTSKWKILLRKKEGFHPSVSPRSAYEQLLLPQNSS